jgi:beta-mannosidase
MELAGDWLATEADDDVRRHGIGLATDEADWELLNVPGHWRNHPKFATSDGPIMYRHSFNRKPPDEGRRRWVTLDGIFYQADIWLDGAYLGDSEGYFFPHSFDITALSNLGDEHVLAVEVTCAAQAGTHGRSNITGVLQQSNDMNAGWNPGGLWRPVHVYDTGPVRIDRVRVLCRDADSRRAHLRISARLDSDQQLPVKVRTLIDGVPTDEQDQVIAEGQNELEWNIDIVDPALWWPRALGDQPMVEIAVEVLIDDEVSDRRQRRTGLRQIVWDNWICSVNGEKLFLKGANLMPTAQGLANASPEQIRRDVNDAVQLGLDALRVHGHIANRETYDAADQSGILLLQDFPLQWGHARSVRSQAVRQARAAVDFFGHHPSIALWSAHNDPAARALATLTAGWKTRARSVAGNQLPSWNKSILDRWVKRSFEKADSSRHTVAHSGVVPHLPQLNGTDSHLTFGWQKGDAQDLARFAARFPRMVRFVSEFGSDSAPTSAAFIDEQLRSHEWPDLDWEQLASDHGYQAVIFGRLFPPADFDNYASWREVTQYYQAHVLKVQIETLRRLKYRPTGGFCFSSLADTSPAISSSVLDHNRVPKAAFEAVRAACAPVLVIADQPPTWIYPTDTLKLDVHLVNDLREPLEFAVVDAVATWVDGEQRWRFGGSVDPDEVVKVGRVELEVPESLGPLTIELQMTAGEITSSNQYSTTVARRP